MTKKDRAAIEIQEVIKQDGEGFTKHLREIAKGKNTVTGYQLRLLLGTYDRCKKFHDLTTHYQAKTPAPHTCAALCGYVGITREGNETLTYTFLDKQVFEARPYQQDIIKRTGKADGSVLIELPTGGGKTFIAREVAREEIAKGGKVLFVAPRTVLLDQTVKTFEEFEPQVIHGNKKYDKNNSVFVSTLQTAHRRKLGFEPSMVIVDESHIGHDGKMMKSLLKDFRGRVVALSATPYNKRGEPLNGFDLHIKDYDTNYMISNGYLVAPECYRAIKLDLKDVKITAGDYNEQSLDLKLNNNKSVIQVVSATKDTIQKRKHCIAFSITIKHADLLAEAYNDAGISAAPYHSGLTAQEKIETMEGFKNGTIKLLTNPASLAEGFDFPELDTLVIARPTKSQNRARQMVGRSLRIADGKSEAVILDCANMIDNTGLPTTPIAPREANDDEPSEKPKCKECESKKLFRTVREQTAYHVCAECGHEEEIESQGGYVCEDCEKYHTNESEFKVIDRKLYLLCDCGHETLISEPTDHESLQAIFDKSLIETMKRTLAAKYLSFVTTAYGYEKIYVPKTKEYVELLMLMIEHYPHQARTWNLEEYHIIGQENKDLLLSKQGSCIAPVKKIVKDERWERFLKLIYDRDFKLGSIFESHVTFTKYEQDNLYWTSNAEEEDKKRLIIHWGFINMCVKDVWGLDTRIISKHASADKDNFLSAVKIVDARRHSRGMSTIPQSFINELVKQIEASDIKDIGNLLMARMYNMDKAGDNLMSAKGLLTFIPYVEKTAREKKTA